MSAGSGIGGRCCSTTPALRQGPGALYSESARERLPSFSFPRAATSLVLLNTSPHMAESEPIEGGCTCRAIRYRMTSTPLFVHCCHCRWCQRETGSAFVLNAMIEADRVV